MRPRILVTVLVGSALSACASIYPPLQSRVVAVEEASQIAWCTRLGVPEFTSGWIPSPADIDGLELSLPRVWRLPKGGRVGRFEQYCYQYSGLVRGGRKTIFVNAYPCGKDEPIPQRYVSICHGPGDWGVVYDAESQEFSNLDLTGFEF